MFRGHHPLLADPVALAAVVSALASGHDVVDKVAGIEARGFILAAPVALQLGAGFVPVRKQGKPARPTHAQSYDLEYGSATVEVHQDAFAPGSGCSSWTTCWPGGTRSATAELVLQGGRRCQDRRDHGIEFPQRAVPAAGRRHPVTAGGVIRAELGTFWIFRR
jgi:adenine phosphoribosyltransferase